MQGNSFDGTLKLRLHGSDWNRTFFLNDRYKAKLKGEHSLADHPDGRFLVLVGLFVA